MDGWCGAPNMALGRPRPRSGRGWLLPCCGRAARPCWRPARPQGWLTMSDPAQPLAGRRIVVTRARAQAGDLVARLRELGAEPLECPAITIVPPASYAPLNA